MLRKARGGRSEGEGRGDGAWGDSEGMLDNTRGLRFKGQGRFWVEMQKDGTAFRTFRTPSTTVGTNLEESGVEHVLDGGGGDRDELIAVNQSVVALVRATKDAHHLQRRRRYVAVVKQQIL